MDFNEGPRLQPVQRRHLAGLGQGVPLMLHAAGIEHQRVVGVGQFGRRQPGPGEEARLAAGGGECQGRRIALRIAQQRLAAAVVEVTQRAAVIFATRCTGPLPWAVAQLLIADAAQVIAGCRVPETPNLFVYRLGIRVIEGLGVAHGAGDPGNDLPVRQALAGRLNCLRHQRQVAFAIDHHALAFGPQRGGQEDIGVAVGFGVEKSVLGDYQLGLAQAVDHLLPVGDAGHRIAADHPAGFHLAGLHLLEQRDRALTAFAAQAARLQAPLLLDEGAVRRHQRRTLARQAGAHIAHLAAAHGIGLAGQ